ncbi:MAG TPA: hypothetical protein DHN33_04655, partial [Eubacteriaceae bacterium]|nr:hypothetical protein [Eubacteriaceae bacterium]
MNNKNFLSSDGVLKRLTAYAKPYWKQFILVFFLIIIITVGSLAQPRLVQILIDQNLSPLFNGERQMEINEFLSQVLPIGLLYLATVGAVFFATYAQIWILNKTGQRILLKIRQQLYDHVLQLPMSYFDTHPLG